MVAVVVMLLEMDFRLLMDPTVVFMSLGFEKFE